jgi:integrase
MNKYRKEPYITQRQGKNGKWSFQVFIRTEGFTITKTFAEKSYGSAKLAFEVAVQFRNRTLADIADNTILRKNNVTVREVFEEFLGSTSLSWKTKDYHQKLFKKYVLHKEKKIQEVTRADITEELNKMVEIASNDTISRVYTLWKNDIIETALAKEYINRDLMAGIRKPESHMIQTKRGVETDRETVLKVEDLVLHCTKSWHEKKVIIAFLETLYYTGMRPAEVAVLTKDDIKKGYISVTKELGSSIEENNVVRRCKSPTSVRDIPIHPGLVETLEELKEIARSDKLFVKDDGQYMDSTWLSDVIRRLCKPKGIEFNMYRLRHNMATSLVANKVDDRTTMDILGHAHYDMSLYYASSSDESRKKAVELLS